MESPEIDPHLYSQLVSNKVTMVIQADSLPSEPPEKHKIYVSQENKTERRKSC